MCGRYVVSKKPEAVLAEFSAYDETDTQWPAADYNVAPTKGTITVVQRHPRDTSGAVLPDEPAIRSVRVMRWGLVPFWAKTAAGSGRMINTRAETVMEKPAFRKALARRRCLVPAAGWFEWKRTDSRKDPYFMTSRDSSSLAFAGIWETWRDPADTSEDSPSLLTFSILTTESVGALADIHHRMPLLMPAQQWATWLDPDLTKVDHLLAPPAVSLVDSLELRPVSQQVNNVRHNGPELIARVEPEYQNIDGVR